MGQSQRILDNKETCLIQTICSTVILSMRPVHCTVSAIRILVWPFWSHCNFLLLYLLSSIYVVLNIIYRALGHLLMQILRHIIWSKYCRAPPLSMRPSSIWGFMRAKRLCLCAGTFSGRKQHFSLYVHYWENIMYLRPYCIILYASARDRGAWLIKESRVATHTLNGSFVIINK